MNETTSSFEKFIIASEQFSNLPVTGALLVLLIISLASSWYLFRSKIKDSEFLKVKLEKSLDEIKDDIQELKTLLIQLRSIK